MGGIVAFEMAGQLAAAGHDVPLVILIDCSVPVPRNAPRPSMNLTSLAGFAADLARTAGRDDWASLERLRGLDPESIRNGTFDQTITRSRDRRRDRRRSPAPAPRRIPGEPAGPGRLPASPLPGPRHPGPGGIEPECPR